MRERIGRAGEIVAVKRVLGTAGDVAAAFVVAV
jgi:hypothetical protein